MLKILSKIYSKIINRRNKAFDIGKIPIFKAKAKVISVGNISVGGSGKTPIVIMLAKYFISKGKNVVVVGSGYKRKSKGLIVVSNYDNILSNANEAGDEMYLIAQSLPNVAVVVDKRKVDAIKYSDNEFEPDIIIIDDGFQHRYAYRDVNLLIIDKRTVENVNTIPYGRLREPIEALKRANVVILRDNVELIPSFQQSVNNIPLFKSFTQINDLYFLKNNEVFTKSEEKFSVISVCGLALPENFANFVIALGFKVEYSFNFRDHFTYNHKSIQRLINKCNELALKLLITTEKDAVKLKDFVNDFNEFQIKILVLPISIQLQNENEFYKLINELLN